MASNGPRLFLAGDDELWEIDVARERVRHVTLPQLAMGDAPYRIVRRGDRLVLWGYDTYVLRPPGDTPELLARGSLFFLPSADPERIWVAFRDPGARRLRSVREVSVTGDVTVPDVRPPGGRWPERATEAGLLFRAVDGATEVWDPARHEVVRTFTFQRLGTYLGPTYGNILVSCTIGCDVLRLTDVRTGKQHRVHAPAGLSFGASSAAFSPSGDRLAIAVRSTALDRTKGRRLALVDVKRREVRLVEGPRVRGGYPYIAWSPSGDDVFLTAGKLRRRTIVWYRVGDERANLVHVNVGAFYGMTAL